MLKECIAPRMARQLRTMGVEPLIPLASFFVKVMKREGPLLACSSMTTHDDAIDLLQTCRGENRLSRETISHLQRDHQARHRIGSKLATHFGAPRYCMLLTPGQLHAVWMASGRYQ